MSAAKSTTTPPRTSLSHDAHLIRMSREITKLERRGTELRRELRIVADDLRAKRRALRAYTQELADGKGFQTPPMRVFGERQG